MDTILQTNDQYLNLIKKVEESPDRRENSFKPNHTDSSMSNADDSLISSIQSSSLYAEDDQSKISMMSNLENFESKYASEYQDKVSVSNDSRNSEQIGKDYNNKSANIPLDERLTDDCTATGNLSQVTTPIRSLMIQQNTQKTKIIDNLINSYDATHKREISQSLSGVGSGVGSIPVQGKKFNDVKDIKVGLLMFYSMFFNSLTPSDKKIPGRDQDDIEPKEPKLHQKKKSGIRLVENDDDSDLFVKANLKVLNSKMAFVEFELTVYKNNKAFLNNYDDYEEVIE